MKNYPLIHIKIIIISVSVIVLTSCAANTTSTITQNSSTFTQTSNSITNQPQASQTPTHHPTQIVESLSLTASTTATKNTKTELIPTVQIASTVQPVNTTSINPTDKPPVIQTIPDISFFASNKSQQFLVDFDHIIAGHPHVGQRSPRPHNDAQVYFSNSDNRWLEAIDPSDYPPIYAVANGIVQLSDPPNYHYYNVIDHSEYDPPWWHVGYTIAIRVATYQNHNINFLYSMEPYITLHNKPMDFYKDFILVEDNQWVNEGDIIGYMYVPPFSERLSGPKSSHIAFGLLKDKGGTWDVYAPAIFSEQIVEQFANIYRNPTEGWNSTSYGYDWNRGRGLPTGMGWMITGSENPFGDHPLDVLMYDGIIDKTLPGAAQINSLSLGFSEQDILYSKEGHGNFTSNAITITTDWKAIVASIGGPTTFNIIFHENSGQIRKTQMFSTRPQQNYAMSISPKINPGQVSFEILDESNWGWAIALAPANSPIDMPGTLIPEGYCPPGCPPSPK